MARPIVEYWMQKRDYGGQMMFRLDRDLLREDFGQPVVEALVSFLGAHYAFNDYEEPASADEKVGLIAKMEQARLVLGGLNPYLFVDSLNVLERDAD